MGEGKILEKIKKLPLFIKILGGIIIMIILLSFFFILYILFFVRINNTLRDEEKFVYTPPPETLSVSSPDSLYVSSPRHFSVPSPESFASPALKDQKKIEVKEGNVSIKSLSWNRDYETIQQKTKEYNGFIGDYYKTEDDEKIDIRASAHIPSNRFDEFFNFLLKNFDVRNSYVKNYKISTKQEFNELDVIRQTINNLDQIEREILNMTANEQKINLLLRINNEKMNLVSRIKSLQNIVEEKMQQGEYSVFSINITQTKPFKIITSDYKEAIKKKIKSIINDSFYSLLDFTNLITFIITSFMILMKATVVGVLVIMFGLVIGKLYLYVKRKLKFEKTTS